MEKASGPLWRLWRPLRCAAQRPCRPWRPRTPLRRLSSSSPSPGLSRCLRGAFFAGGLRGIGGWRKSSQVKFITPRKQGVATALWVGENSKTLKIMLVAVPALNFRGFGGFGVLFAPPPSSLGEPGEIVLRFRGFLLLLFRVFRDFVVAPDLQAGRGGIT